MAEQSLKSKTVKGVGWSFVDTVANQGMSFLVGLVLARLLSPSEYGLIGIIIIFITVFNAIVDSGFSNALIRNNKATDIDYSTGFITNLVFSIFLYIVLFLCAPVIALFFKQPILINLLRVMGIIIIINAFALIQRTVLVKKIDFKTQTWASLVSSIFSGFIGICMAYNGMGVWALVGQQISRQLVNTVCLWVFSKWMPQLRFSIASFKTMWGFGWKLLVSSLINNILNEIFQVVIGKCYTPAALGEYTRAKQFRDMFSQTLTSVIQRVTFPILSSIQDDKDRLKEGYRRIIKITVLPTFLLLLGMVAISKSMILVLIGEKWIDCVPMLQIICIYGMLYPLHAINLNMLQVQGRSDLFLKLEVIKDLLIFVPIGIGVIFNIYAMLWANLVVQIIAYYLNAYYSGPFLNYSFIDQVKDILPSLSVAFAMSLLVYLLSFLPLSIYILFPVQIIFGITVSVSLCEIVKLQEYIELRNIVIHFIKRS